VKRWISNGEDVTFKTDGPTSLLEIVVAKMILHCPSHWHCCSPPFTSSLCRAQLEVTMLPQGVSILCPFLCQLPSLRSDWISSGAVNWVGEKEPSVGSLPSSDSPQNCLSAFFSPPVLPNLLSSFLILRMTVIVNLCQNKNWADVPILELNCNSKCKGNVEFLMCNTSSTGVHGYNFISNPSSLFADPF
jgi:hypothetical protein